MQTTSYSLGELLRRVKDQNLTIPQFQRKFIWRESQVRLLVDSISRSYPIGSLLMLDKKPDLPLASRSIQATIREGYPPDNLFNEVKRIAEAESYILDGQQRTTSIARLFLNAHPTKLYYFDLKEMWESHREEETSWIRFRTRGKTEPDRKNNGRLLRADLVLDQKKADIYVSEYMEDSGDFPNLSRQAAREAAAFIKGIFETVRNYKIPVVTLDRDRGIESVCRVFETINSTGTRLRTFDLAVARFFPEPDLRRLWEDALDRYPILKDFEVDGEHVLQVLCLVLTKREPSRQNQLDLSPDVISQEWARSSEALAITYQWARAQGARPPKILPNRNILVALAAVRSLFSSDDLNSKVWPDNDFIRRWYFSKVMRAGASQASNYRIGQDFSALRRYIEEGIQPSSSPVKPSKERRRFSATDGWFRLCRNGLESFDPLRNSIRGRYRRRGRNHIAQPRAHRDGGSVQARTGDARTHRQTRGSCLNDRVASRLVHGDDRFSGYPRETNMNNGNIIEIIGAVVDMQFPREECGINDSS